MGPALRDMTLQYCSPRRDPRPKASKRHFPGSRGVEFVGGLMSPHLGDWEDVIAPVGGRKNRERGE